VGNYRIVNKGADSGIGFCFDKFRFLEQARKFTCCYRSLSGRAEGLVPKFNKSGVPGGFFVSAV